MKVHFLITNGQLAGTVVPVAEGQTLTFGRSDMSDIVVPDGKASRIHCKVQNLGKTCELFDLNSSNGTYCNQRRIERQQLKPGDEVMVGETVMIFEVAPVSESAIQQPTGSQAVPLPAEVAVPSEQTDIPPGQQPGQKRSEHSFVRTHKFCGKCGRIIPKKEMTEGRAREVDEIAKRIADVEGIPIAVSKLAKVEDVVAALRQRFG